MTLLRGFGPEGSQLCSQNSAFQLHEIWGFSVQEFYNYWAHHGIPINWKLNYVFSMEFVAKKIDISEPQGPRSPRAVTRRVLTRGTPPSGPPPDRGANPIGSIVTSFHR